MMPTTLRLAAIQLDTDCQPRAVTDLNLAGEYAEAMLLGAQFPPVVVFGDDDAGYWLADGYHRWHAAEIAGLGTIACEVRPGGRREAILHSVGANAEHGWRRTNEDKRRAVLTLLNDPEWRQWSDREISRRCGVDGKTVASLRPVTAELPQLDPVTNPTRTYTDKHGNTSTMNTAGIGRPRVNPDLDREYTFRDDPRQLHIPTVSPSHVYDKRAMHICSDLVALFEKLNSADWPDPDNAMDAWMTDRSDGPSPDEVQFAADWLAEFAALFRTHEPRRLKAVQAMLDRAKEITNGTH
jgi:hypothetical protein